MTLRERIADWITSGEYSLCKAHSYRLQKYFAPQMDRAHDALRDIIDMETPGANATVKRMARTAREALK